MEATNNQLLSLISQAKKKVELSSDKKEAFDSLSSLILDKISQLESTHTPVQEAPVAEPVPEVTKPVP